MFGLLRVEYHHIFLLFVFISACEHLCVCCGFLVSCGAGHGNCGAV